MTTELSKRLEVLFDTKVEKGSVENRFCRYLSRSFEQGLICYQLRTTKMVSFQNCL